MQTWVEAKAEYIELFGSCVDMSDKEEYFGIKKGDVKYGQGVKQRQVNVDNEGGV